MVAPSQTIVHVFIQDVTMTIIFDIDGTVADCSHRIHLIAHKPKRWAEFFGDVAGDKPIVPMCALAKRLTLGGESIVWLTGRSEICREDTSHWLNLFICPGAGRLPLYMRAANDRRDDTIVKSELLDRVVKDGHVPTIIFEDRKRVVDMWRKRGIVCAQVAEGDF